jgi:hypothetical protein
MAKMDIMKPNTKCLNLKIRFITFGLVLKEI